MVLRADSRLIGLSWESIPTLPASDWSAVRIYAGGWDVHDCPAALNGAVTVQGGERGGDAQAASAHRAEG